MLEHAGNAAGATTWALRRSVSVKAARIEPSCSCTPKSMLRTRRLNTGARGVEMGAAVLWSPRREAGDRKAARRCSPRVLHGPVEIVPERVAGNSPVAGSSVRRSRADFQPTRLRWPSPALKTHATGAKRLSTPRLSGSGRQPWMRLGQPIVGHVSGRPRHGDRTGRESARPRPAPSAAPPPPRPEAIADDDALQCREN